jgi:hypothetical protein
MDKPPVNDLKKQILQMFKECLHIIGIHANERKIMAFAELCYYGDMLTDKHGIKPMEILKVIKMDKYRHLTPVKKVKSALDILKLNDAAYNKLIEVLKSQEISMVQQSRNNINEYELLKISMDKGGKSAELMILAFNSCVPSNELHAAYLLGAFVQLYDDWADYYQDIDEGVQTVYTNNYWKYGDLVNFSNYLISTYRKKGYYKYANAIKYLMSLKHLAEYKREMDKNP